MPTKSIAVLGRLLIVMGAGYVIIGYGWLITAIGQRISGVDWMMIIGADRIVGVGWIIIGAFAAVAGFLSRRHRTIETAGTVAAVAWPLLIGGLFMVAWVTGEHATGWISAAVYAILSAVVVTVATAPVVRISTTTEQIHEGDK